MQSLRRMSLVLLILLSVGPSLAQDESGSAAPVEQCGSLREENYWLQKQVESLKTQLAEAREACNLADTMNRSHDDLSAAEKRSAEAAASAKRRQEEALARLRGSVLPLQEWQEILMYKSTEQVSQLLGQPTTVSETNSPRAYKLDSWTYAQRVKAPNNPKVFRTLKLSFSQGQVVRVDAQ